LKGAREHDNTRKRIESDGLLLSIEWWEEAKRASDHEEGMPFSANLFGEKVLKEYFTGHTTLHRMFKMLTAIHKQQWSGNPTAALAQTTQCIKAVSACLKNNGSWKGAWELTHISDVNETDGGIPLAEAASLGKFLREKAAVEALIEAARGEAAKGAKKG
jgi:hypothetical protein